MRSSSEAAIVSLALAGMRPCDIAAQVGRQPSTVYHYLARARRSGVAIPRFKFGSGWSGRRFLVALDPCLKPRLAAAAAQRGIDPREMAARLIDACVSSDLIDAVLDDGEAGDA